MYMQVHMGAYISNSAIGLNRFLLDSIGSYCSFSSNDAKRTSSSGLQEVKYVHVRVLVLVRVLVVLVVVVLLLLLLLLQQQ